MSLLADALSNHHRFVTRVAASECVWGVRDASGFASCPSNDDPDRAVLMFWSDQAYARRACVATFGYHEPATIPLFDFLFRWLSGMQKDRVLAGTNWNGDFAGIEMEPSALFDELFEALPDALVLKYNDESQRLKACGDAPQQAGAGLPR